MAAVQEPSTPPAIPEKHPGRLSRSKTCSSMRRSGLNCEYLDIWEHATLLYYGFEWQAAAETFLMLSRQIKRKIESTLCLLNAAIIFARLGDHVAASQILSEAEPEGDIFPLAMFIMGHVEFQQGNYEQSEDSFKVALSNLSGPSQCYDAYGLIFTLRASHIQQNLRIFETKHNLFGVLGSIGALPADGVFEAPSRPFTRPSAAPTLSRTSSSSDDVPTLSDGSSPVSLTSSPVGRYSEDVSGDVRWYANRDGTTGTVSNDFDFGFEDNNHAPKSTMYAFPPTSDPMAIGSLVRSLSQNQAPTIAPPRKVSRHSLVPREARVHGNLTQPLAKFIRELPSQNAMEPRSAILEVAPTTDLATFLRASEQQDSQRRPSVHRSTSNQSSSSGSWEAHSIQSVGLQATDDPTQRSQSPAQEIGEPPSKHQKHRYRSGVGAILLRENSPSPPAHRSLNRRTNSIESTRMDPDSLHSFLCGGTNDRQSIRSYVFTDEARSTYSQPRSRPVSMTAVHPALRPDIPSRTTSLLRQAPSQLTREVRTEQPQQQPSKPIRRSVVLATNYSDLRPAAIPSTTSTVTAGKEESGYSRFL